MVEQKGTPRHPPQKSEQKRNPNDRHRPGYVAPKRDGKLGVNGYLTPQQHAAAKEIAQRKRMTITDLATVALIQYIKRNAPKPN